MPHTRSVADLCAGSTAPNLADVKTTAAAAGVGELTVLLQSWRMRQDCTACLPRDGCGPGSRMTFEAMAAGQARGGCRRWRPGTRGEPECLARDSLPGR